jgi:Putative MetA-pathway of phenol degradation
VLNVNRAWLSLNLFVWFVLASSQAWALESTEDIDTNRPSFMDSPLVVPKGSLQLENGTLYQHFQHGLTYYDIPETEVRLGLTKKTEFQMFVPNWVLLHSVGSSTVNLSNINPSLAAIQTTPSSTRQGVSDLNEIGIKHQLPTLFKDLTVSVIGGVTVPTGRNFISGTGVQPVIRAPWGKALPKNWSINGMQSILVVNSGSDVQWQNFWLLNKTFGTRTSVFIEYAGFYTHGAAPSNIIHFGVVRKLNRHNQIDTHFGFGLNQAAPAAFVGVGYSFRFDGLPLL